VITEVWGVRVVGVVLRQRAAAVFRPVARHLTPSTARRRRVELIKSRGSSFRPLSRSSTRSTGPSTSYRTHSRASRNDYLVSSASSSLWDTCCLPGHVTLSEVIVPTEVGLIQTTYRRMHRGSD